MKIKSNTLNPFVRKDVQPEGNRLDFDIQLRSDESTDEERVFEGVASSKQVDTYATYFEPRGVRYELPIPLLWHHDREKPIGYVESISVSDTEVRFKARVLKIEGPAGGLTDRVDEAWASLKSGLIRSVSIGFRPKKYTPLESGVIRFDEWDLNELSLVTIPANSDAKITAVRAAQSLDNAREAACIESTKETKVTKPESNQTKRETKKMTLQEKLAALKKTRQERADVLSGLMERSDNDTTLDGEDAKRFDEVSEELKVLDADIARCERAIEVMKSKADPVEVKTTSQAVRESTPRNYAQPRVSLSGKEAKAATYARYVAVHAKARGSRSDMIAYAQEYSAATGDQRLENAVRAAVAIGTTQTGNWASPLVDDYQTAKAEFVEILRAQTIIGKLDLSPMGFYIPIKEQTVAGVAGWVGETQAKPATSQGFETKSMQPHKLAAITAISDELLKWSSPKADTIIINDLTNAIQGAADLTLVLPTWSGSASAPASITFGAANAASSGNSFANVIADFQRARQHYLNNGIPLNGISVLMNPLTASALFSVRAEQTGVRLFPDITPEGGSVEGFRVVVSEHIPFDSTGAMVVFVRDQDVYIGDEDGVQIATSNEATVNLSTNPTAETGNIVNAFQDNVTLIRAEREISWMKKRSQAVFYLTGVNWGAPTAP